MALFEEHPAGTMDLVDPDPVDQVVASARLEGVDLDPQLVAEMRRYAAGDITHDELHATVLQRVAPQHIPG